MDNLPEHLESDYHYKQSTLGLVAFLDMIQREQNRFVCLRICMIFQMTGGTFLHLVTVLEKHLFLF